MHSFVNCFTPFKSSIANVILPERFTFPFYYQPHPLSLLAVKGLQNYLEHQTAWQHDFGFVNKHASASGKMFGVLVVQNLAGELGYLSAFSGKLADQSIVDNFVPPVFDTFSKDGFFLIGQSEINQINDHLESLQSNVEIEDFSLLLAELIKEAESHIASYREVIIEGRKQRKAKREVAKKTLDEHALGHINEQLSKESIKEKNQLRGLKLFWQDKTTVVENQLTQLTDEIEQLKQQRKVLSNALQQTLFNHYRFLNIKGEEKNLNAIFDEIPERTPPAGSGDCAAPKLLQYAFHHNLKPITMAEFWWGAAPKSEIRQHKNFYGSCQGKCQPILGHMLSGIELDDNPLLINPAVGKTLDIVYQDEHMLVINKPSEFLSVPGKNIEDSVYSRIRAQFPEATGPLIVHRLDMSTSGLMVIALTKRAHKKLQQQFISRVVEKRYVALIDGDLLTQSGVISLPLRVDLNDRPRQVVCYNYGKSAETSWQVIAKNEGERGKFTRVHLYPKTGRTHQLRMHCAHVDGLNMPIVGDDLYGHKAKRLHLHAAYLAFMHPVTKEKMVFEAAEQF
ncbi:MAG: pseudouridine synthase [Colwellia sp.]|nr:pseudouridine synthase [Colwellia sp.]